MGFQQGSSVLEIIQDHLGGNVVWCLCPPNTRA